jgi:hypothetical protein
VSATPPPLPLEHDEAEDDSDYGTMAHASAPSASAAPIGMPESPYASNVPTLARAAYSTTKPAVGGVIDLPSEDEDESYEVSYFHLHHYL